MRWEVCRMKRWEVWMVKHQEMWRVNFLEGKKQMRREVKKGKPCERKRITLWGNEKSK